MPYRTGIGLDKHARTIAAAFVPGTGEAAERSFGYGPAPVAAWAAGLPQPARAACGSGPTGFDLKRPPGSPGLSYCVGAVGKMPRPSGGRVECCTPHPR